MDKSDLREYWWKRKNIERLTETLEELKALRACQSPRLSDEPRSTGFKDKIGDLVIKLDEVEAKLVVLLAEAYEALKKIEDAIEALPEREKLLMRLRYIHFKEWTEIAVEMHYGWTQIHHIHSNCLRMMGIEKERTQLNTRK